MSITTDAPHAKDELTTTTLQIFSFTVNEKSFTTLMAGAIQTASLQMACSHG